MALARGGSGTRSTAEELFDELGIVPTTLTLASNGAIRESVLVGLGITLISRDAVGRELEQGHLEEWQCPGLRRERSWHVVGRAGEELPATAALFLAHLGSPGRPGHDGFRLTGPSAGVPPEAG
ncbi:MAG: LysR substrate-binding domain-containing protein [Actinomycetota bacterium]|nr:LysR substrate-binding domain-containing protein [Actinomycetota bacterium]